MIETLGRLQSTGLQRGGHNRSDPAHIETRFFCLCHSAPVRVEHEGGAAAWLAGSLAAPSVQGHGLPTTQELWPYQSLFSVALPIQALTGFPGWGPTL